MEARRLEPDFRRVVRVAGWKVDRDSERQAGVDLWALSSGAASNLGDTHGAVGPFDRSDPFKKVPVILGERRLEK
jgi:hypothetical protein